MDGSSSFFDSLSSSSNLTYPVLDYDSFVIGSTITAACACSFFVFAVILLSGTVNKAVQMLNYMVSCRCFKPHPNSWMQSLIDDDGVDDSIELQTPVIQRQKPLTEEAFVIVDPDDPDEDNHSNELKEEEASPSVIEVKLVQNKQD